MSGGCPSQFTASTLTSVISDGTLDRRIAQLKMEYTRRAQAYMRAIEEYWAPLGAKYVPCTGGYFIWVTLPEGITSEEVFKEGMEEGVWIMEGMSCMVPDDSSVEYNRFIRICIALEKEDKAREGIARLAVVFKRLLGRIS